MTNWLFKSYIGNYLLGSVIQGSLVQDLSTNYRSLKYYYALQSNLQIQRSALLDCGTLRVHLFTPDCCKGFYQIHSVCHDCHSVSIISAREVVLVLY